MLHTLTPFTRFALALTVISLQLLITVPGSTQQTQEKSRSDKFGSSLDKLNQKQNKKPAPEKQPANKDADDSIRLDSALAVFDLMVLDKAGKPVTGFKKEDFAVTEDGKKQEITTVVQDDGTAAPRSIILILDYSMSLLSYIKTSTGAAEVLVDNLGPKDKMAVVTDDVSLLVDFTNNKKALKDALQALNFIATTGRRFGKSQQFSALMATLKELLNENEQSVIIFQTDGDQLSVLKPKAATEFSSFMNAPFSIDDLYSAVDKCHATVYSIIPGPSLMGLSEDKLAEQFKQIDEREMSAVREVDPAEYQSWKELRDKSTDKQFKARAKERLNQHMALFSIAQKSGGWTEYLETPDKAQDIYSRIFSSMNQRYVVTYYPTNTNRDGKLRKVKIEVRNHPEYTIRGRNTYYAPQD